MQDRITDNLSSVVKELLYLEALVSSLSNMIGAGVRAVAERHVEEVCAENITKFRSDMSRKRNQSSLSELFISFLAKVSRHFLVLSHQVNQYICYQHFHYIYWCVSVFSFTMFLLN